MVICLLLLTCVGRSDNWQTELTGVMAMSSPRVADLTGDGVKDVVMGGGADEWERSDSAVLALDGQTGKLLWHTSGRNQVFGSATFLDINRDGTPDVIIGGRSAELQAINGRNGQKLWEFFRTNDHMGHKRAGWFNFTNAQLIPDQDHDGLDDLLIGNGGDATIGDVLSLRPIGRLMVLSSRSGKILHDARRRERNVLLTRAGENRTGPIGVAPAIWHRWRVYRWALLQGYVG